VKEKLAYILGLVTKTKNVLRSSLITQVVGFIFLSKKVKQSHNTTMEAQGREEL
jgi:hypothetical protein